MIATHKENDQTWQAWSEAVEIAENMPTGTPQEQAAWERADALWAEWQDKLDRVHLDEMVQDGYAACIKPLLAIKEMIAE